MLSSKILWMNNLIVSVHHKKIKFYKYYETNKIPYAIAPGFYFLFG